MTQKIKSYEKYGDLRLARDRATKPPKEASFLESTCGLAFCGLLFILSFIPFIGWVAIAAILWYRYDSCKNKEAIHLIKMETGKTLQPDHPRVKEVRKMIAEQYTDFARDVHNDWLAAREELLSDLMSADTKVSKEAVRKHIRKAD